MKVAIMNNKEIENILLIRSRDFLKKEELHLINFDNMKELVKWSKKDRIDILIIDGASISQVKEIKVLHPLSTVIILKSNMEKLEKTLFIKAGCYEVIEKDKIKNFESTIKESVSRSKTRLRHLR